MRQTLTFFALLFAAFSVKGQISEPVWSQFLDRHPELGALREAIASRQGLAARSVTYRLDSVHGYGYSQPGDSTIFRKDRYTYFGDSVEIKTIELYDPAVGAFYIKNQTLNKWNPQGQLLLYEDRNDWGQGLVATQRVQAFWRPDGMLLDSLWSFQIYWPDTALILHERNINTVYTADGLLQSVDIYEQTTPGWFVRDTYAYEADGRTDYRVGVSYKTDGSGVFPKDSTDYWYAGDSTLVSYYSAALWSEPVFQTLTIGNLDPELRDAYFYFANTQFAYGPLYSDHNFFDNAGRKVRWDRRVYDPLSFNVTTIVRTTYEYNSLGNLYRSIQERDENANGNYLLQGKDYYFFQPQPVHTSSPSDAPQVLLWPNPASGQIQVDAGTDRIERIEVWDASGRLVYVAYPRQAQWTWPVSSWATGVYTLHVYEGKTALTRRFVVTP